MRPASSEDEFAHHDGAMFRCAFASVIDGVSVALRDSARIYAPDRVTIGGLEQSHLEPKVFDCRIPRAV